MVVLRGSCQRRRDSLPLKLLSALSNGTGMSSLFDQLLASWRVALHFGLSLAELARCLRRRGQCLVSMSGPMQSRRLRASAPAQVILCSQAVLSPNTQMSGLEFVGGLCLHGFCAEMGAAAIRLVATSCTQRCWSGLCSARIRSCQLLFLWSMSYLWWVRLSL